MNRTFGFGSHVCRNEPNARVRSYSLIFAYHSKVVSLVVNLLYPFLNFISLIFKVLFFFNFFLQPKQTERSGSVPNFFLTFYFLSQSYFLFYFIYFLFHYYLSKIPKIFFLIYNFKNSKNILFFISFLALILFVCLFMGKLLNQLSVPRSMLLYVSNASPDSE